MIRVGVIGCGYWGPNLIRNFSELKDAVVTTVCDGRAERIRYVQKRFPSIQGTDKAEKLIRSPHVDAVAIATPVSTHFELALLALQAGKHVLIEKPMVLKSTEAGILVRLARRKRRVLMVGNAFVYSGAVNKMKELIQSGEIGTVHYFDSIRVNLGIFQGDANVIWDLAPHDLSILFYVLGQYPNRVIAVGGSHVYRGVENIAYITLRFPSKLIAHIHVNWLAPVKTRLIVVGGSKKMVVYDDVEPIDKIKVYDKGVVVPSRPNALFEKQLIYRTGDMHAPKLDTTETLQVECNHFISCIQRGLKPRSDGESGLKIVRVLEAIQTSIRASGKEVRIKAS